MADLKDLNIFNSNKGIDKIKRRQSNKESKVKEPVVLDNSSNKVEKKDTKHKKNGVGAPIQNFDRVFATTKGKPIKVSALLHATSTVLGEKFMTEMSRDEILRKALDQYIRTNLTKEDKLLLYKDVTRDLDIYRKSNPTVYERNVDGKIIKTIEEIERETDQILRKNWEI